VLSPTVRVEASLKASGSFGLQIPFFAKYDGTWDTGLDPKLEGMFAPNEFPSPSVSLDLTFAPKFEALLMGIAGPYVAPTVSGSLERSLNPPSEPCASCAELSVAAGGEYGVAVHFLDHAPEPAKAFQIAELELWKQCLPQADGGRCDGAGSDASADAPREAGDASLDSSGEGGDGSKDAGVDADASSAVAPIAVPTAPAPPSGRGALSIGDPHLLTFDGLKYDIQAVGELTLARDLGGDFEVQVRTKPWGARLSVAVNAVVAAKVGNDRLTFYADGSVRKNGVPVTLPEGKTAISASGAIYRSGANYALVWPDNTQLRVSYNWTFIALQVFLDGGRSGHVAGLLGDFDGSPVSDLKTRAGVSLESQPSFDTFYHVFAESWRIEQSDSLFDYDAGQTTETFTDRSFPHVHATVKQLTNLERLAGIQACQAAGVPAGLWFDDCVLDVGLTGNGEFARHYLFAAPPETKLEIDPSSVPDAGSSGDGGSISDGGSSSDIGSSGSMAVSGSIAHGEQKSYSFTASAGQGIQIRVADVGNPAFVAGVAVYDSTGKAISSARGNEVAYASFAIQTNGAYTIVVSDLSARTDITGNYTLYFTKAPGANKGGELKAGGVVAGAIEKGELDSYTFTANVGQGVQLRVTDLAGGAFVPAMSVYDPSGALVTFTYSADVANASVTAQKNGTYTVVVYDWSSGAASSGGYNLSLQLTAVP
jgi:hypothetical protein